MKDIRNNEIKPNYNFGKETLIYKFPYNNPLFLNTEEILNWSFSDRILVTTFDLYKDDSFVQYLERTGLTLKQHLRDLGLNKEVKIMSDTGIFEFEARKAKLDLQTDFLSKELTTTEIFHAYELIDPDYLIAPDEIILLEDIRSTRYKKIQTIKDNLLKTLDIFPMDKIYATLQGIEEEEIDELLQFFNDNDVTKVARGGIIPLRKANKSKYYHVLQQSEKKSRMYNVEQLHAFGLYSLRSVGDYLVINSYDSLDTSAIYWISANRKYILFDGKQIAVRKAELERCICFGCQQMNKYKEWASISTKFIIFLYYHNAWQFTRIVTQLHNDPIFAKTFLPNLFVKNSQQNASMFKISTKEKTNDIHLFSAAEISIQRKLEGSQSKYHQTRIDNKNYKRPPSRILIISNCTAKKSRLIPKELRFSDAEELIQLQDSLKKYKHLQLPARDQYKGRSHEIICKAVDVMKEFDIYLEVDHIIFSGAYGLIKATEPILPYDFNLRHTTNEEKRLVMTQIRQKKVIETIIKRKPDIIISTLSPTYQQILTQLIKPYLNHLQRSELVYIHATHQSTTDNHWTDYHIDEFYKLYKLGNLKHSPGTRYQAKANILLEFCKEQRYNNIKNGLYFSDYWHSLTDCLCWKE